VEIAASSVSDSSFRFCRLREYGASTRVYSRLSLLRDNGNGKDIGIKTAIIPESGARFSSGTISRMNPRMALSRAIFHSFPRAMSSNEENTFRIAELNLINKRDRRETSASDFLRESKLKIEGWTARKRARGDSDAGGEGGRSKNRKLAHHRSRSALFPLGKWKLTASKSREHCFRPEPLGVPCI